MIQTWNIVHRADDVDRSIWLKMMSDEEAVHRARLIGDQTKVVKPSTKYKLKERTSIVSGYVMDGIIYRGK